MFSLENATAKILGLFIDKKYPFPNGKTL